jgi:putative transport protein
MVELFHSQPVLTLFLIFGIGYLVGGIRIGGFSLGPVAGVLFAGLFFGQYELRMSASVQSLGFALFIFSVGYQAGPRFFDVLRTDGLRYLLLAMVIASTGFGIALVATQFLGLAPGTSAGLLSGGLTSSPTLAAAQEAIRSGQISPPEGMSADAMVGNVATGYAITYIFGLAGLIAVIKVLPQLLGIDLVAEAKRLEAEDDAAAGAPVSNVAARIYRITNEEVTRAPVGELREKYWDEKSVVRVRRDGELSKLDPSEPLRLGDELVVLGPVEYFTETMARLGEEVAPEVSTAKATESARLVVMHKDAAGKSLAELDIPRRFGVLVTGLTRMRLPVPLTSGLVLSRGDILEVVGPQEWVDLLGAEVGHVERPIAETDMVTFAFGVAAGVAIGMISINLGGIPLGLGSAGGLLTSGLIIGYLRSKYPVFGRLPEGARWFLMEFGLLLFMAGVGLRAGGDILETLAAAGPSLVVAGICVTIVPVVVGYAFGRIVLKINPVLLLGGITGSMTSGASLSVVTSAARSDVPALGYTGAYAFVNVLLTDAGSLILFF